MEKKVAEVLLEEPLKIAIGGEVYMMNPPSIATLVLASKYIGQLPNKVLNQETLIPSMLKIAPNLLPVGNALAVMILGAKAYNEYEHKDWQFLRKNRLKKGEVLAEKINNSNISELLASFYKVLELMNLQDFFQLTTFLIELNMTKATKEKVVN